LPGLVDVPTVKLETLTLATWGTVNVIVGVAAAVVCAWSDVAQVHMKTISVKIKFFFNVSPTFSSFEPDVVSAPCQFAPGKCSRKAKRKSEQVIENKLSNFRVGRCSVGKPTSKFQQKLAESKK
jgi:hypothetical protein